MHHRKTQIGTMGIASCKALALAAAIGCCLPAYAAGAETATAREAVIDFDIPAGDLSAALEKFSTQSGIQTMYRQDLVAGKRSRALSGRHTPGEALNLLLSDSGLQPERINASTLVLKKAPAPANSMPPEARNRSRQREERVAVLPGIMVQGEKTLNVDIARSIDDPQPYVVFNAETIATSGAINLDDFLRKRLTMVTPGASWSQLGYVGGNASTVRLRGLGEGQTLILVDGRRIARTSAGYGSGQADINAIPLSSIERVEVLPTTASAIYGGSATGGVINIVLKRGYTGSQLRMTFDDSFDTDASNKRIDFSQGMSFNDGRTSLNINLSKSEQNELLNSDRDFVARARERNPDDRFFGAYPPLGTTANIRSADGSNLVLRDGTVLASDITHAPSGYLGVASDGGAALAANAGAYNLDIPNAAIPGAGGYRLIPESRTQAFSATLSHEFNDRLTGYLDVSRQSNEGRNRMDMYGFFTLAASAPTNPFQQSIIINTYLPETNGMQTSKTSSDKLGAGLVYRLGGDWSVALDYTMTVSELSYRMTASRFYSTFQTDLNLGLVDLTRDPALGAFGLSRYDMAYAAGYSVIGLPVKSIARVPSLRLSGPIWSLPGGDVSLSMLLERNDLYYGQGGQLAPNVGTIFPPRWQTTDSVYAEFNIPIVGAANARPWVKELDLQIAARHDRFDATNASHVSWYLGSPIPPFQYINNKVNETSPLIAFRYRPNDRIMLRGSVGDGFLTPDVDQLGNPTRYMSFQGALRDPKRGLTAPAQEFLYSQGGNPDLSPESSRSWSAGLVLTPFEGSDFRFSVDYTRIKKDNVITTLSGQLILDNEDYFPGRIVRGERLPTDPVDWAGPILEFDGSILNGASALIESYDFKLDNRWDSDAWGTLTLYGGATLLTRYEQQIAPSLPAEDRLGWKYSAGAIPVRWRVNLGLDWAREAWGAGWNANFYDDYIVASPTAASSAATLARQGNGGKVPSQLYHDVYVKYAFPLGGSEVGLPALLLDSEVMVGVRNVFGKTPRFDYTDNLGYYSSFGDPRVMSYYVSFTKNF